MKTEILTLSLLSGLAVIILAIFVAILIYEREKKKKTLAIMDPNDWLFADFHHKFYDVMIGKVPEGTMFGVDVEQYSRYCKICHVEEDVKKMISMKMEGIFLAILCMGLGYITGSQFLICAPFYIAAMAAFYFLYYAPYNNLKTKAEARIYVIEDTLPRYLTLLEKALDLPIEQAIEVTAKKYHSYLTDDLIDCCNKVRFGADGWQKVLTDLATVYSIDSFNGFVMDILHAYKQGADIKDAVARKAYALEQERLYAVEQEDARQKTLVFVPMMIFKIVPLMALFCIPMLSSVTGM